jgi:hypothetical protein
MAWECVHCVSRGHRLDDARDVACSTCELERSDRWHSVGVCMDGRCSRANHRRSPIGGAVCCRAGLGRGVRMRWDVDRFAEAHG